MIGLIMVASMVPGLMIGLRRSTAIDFDAVAYRTGAILVEDPGWPLLPPWELSSDKGGIERFGLAVSNTPNVLSMSKIEKFNGKGVTLSYPNDYRQRLIFGDYPYRFNISIIGTEMDPVFVGEPLPTLPSYGYIRRMVEIKNTSPITIDFDPTGPLKDYYNVSSYNSSNITYPQKFTVRFNMSELVSKSIEPAYQFDPRIDPIILSITNLSYKMNWSSKNNSTGFFPYAFPAAANTSMWTPILNCIPERDNITSPCFFRPNLSAVKIYKNSVPLPAPLNYKLLIDSNNSTLSASRQVINSIYLELEPGTLPIDESTVLDIEFNFNDTPARTLISGIYNVNYTSAGIPHGIVHPSLQNGWLEVAIW